MKDKLGTEIKVGDTVVFMAGGGKFHTATLETGTVLQSTSNKVKIDVRGSFFAVFKHSFNVIVAQRTS